METLGYLIDGFGVALAPHNLMFALIGAFLGTLIGALPGLGPANGVAILIPLAFTLGLPPETALIMLTSVYAGAMYGGRISSILLNIPGDEPAMMTCLDGYPMAQKGKAAEALAISAIASFMGSLIATIGLILLAPLLAKFALTFGPAEYFALFVLAFATLGGITGKNPVKTILAAAIGLMIATVGIDSTGTQRYTFGVLELYEGIDFIIAIVGLFAISELLFFIESRAGGGKGPMKVNKLSLSWKEIGSIFPTTLRGGVLGFISGVLPGAGASLGSFISYTLEKKILGSKGHFGEGDPRGVAAPEAGNNGASSGALVPMLTLGVPGSGTTAVLLALLISMNITPGPMMFTQNADIVWGVIAALLVGNFLLLLLNIPLVGIFVKLLSVPPKYLLPIVTMVAFVGIYSISNSAFDLYFMVAFGVAGYILRKLEIPLVPIILGLLLGPEMEKNLGHALTLSNGDWSVLWSSGLSITLWALAIIGLVLPVVVGPILRRRMRAAQGNVD
ncbi:tripartite tricarboxylate transporter permease [Chromohalobacter sp. TMW 2.2308]|uniref:Tripartite tricarboxylate transporter permease n=2 Tax=Chromohalobacter TaxID=42054 RepID=A0A9X3B492_9GAMM|nr:MULTISPECIES: tripartite tricarboxylate transporter permease [Chromohalobacter]CDQ33087.1 Tripartite tricarboxylate transporter TctA family protein [Virgibacillus halodenitrificans]MCK2041935.1 tripartite tricarboxylate transporter permease [Chromohalobacter moromii]MCK2044864.1 tripartite tricarboxylate transporter permease [Chromohalobacter moromii]MCT8503983.1 tripartite tricarboxylate transporter permease [Chromohalobacter moromii]MCT8514083.1 tripartite tricarboxylate transporter perme